MSPHHPQSFPCLVQCDSLHPISEEGPRPPATAPESGRPTSRLLTSSLHVLVTCAATTPSRAPITTHRLTPSAPSRSPPSKSAGQKSPPVVMGLFSLFVSSTSSLPPTPTERRSGLSGLPAAPWHPSAPPPCPHSGLSPLGGLPLRLRHPCQG